MTIDSSVDVGIPSGAPDEEKLIREAFKWALGEKKFDSGREDAKNARLGFAMAAGYSEKELGGLERRLEIEEGAREAIRSVDWKTAAEGGVLLGTPVAGFLIGRGMSQEDAMVWTAGLSSYGILHIGLGALAARSPRLRGIAELLIRTKVVAIASAGLGLGIAAGSYFPHHETASSVPPQIGGQVGGSDLSPDARGGVTEGVRPSVSLSGRLDTGPGTMPETEYRYDDTIDHLPDVESKIPAGFLGSSPETAVKEVIVQAGDTFSEIIDRAGGDAYGVDFNKALIENEGVLTDPTKNPHADTARVLTEYLKSNPEVTWTKVNGDSALADTIIGGYRLGQLFPLAAHTIRDGLKLMIGGFVSR